MEHCGVNADADAMIAPLYPPKRRAAGEGPFGNDLGGQATSAASVADIKPKLAQGAANRQ